MSIGSVIMLFARNIISKYIEKALAVWYNLYEQRTMGELYGRKYVYMDDKFGYSQSLKNRTGSCVDR